MMIIDLEKLENKQYQLEIINDIDKLHDIITQTRGFILYLMKKNELFPSLEILLEKESLFSLDFILNNYQLDNKQRQKLRGYFLQRSSNQVVAPNLSEEEIKEQISEKMVLSNTAILTLEMMKNYSQELIDNKNFNNTDNIIKQSLLNLSPQKIFELPSTLLKAFSNVLNKEEFENFFANEQFAQSYKELLMKDAEDTHIKLKIDDFRYYHFKEKDKVLLKELLKNGSYNGEDNYKTLSKIKGVSDLISLKEYFLHYNNTLYSFTEEELLTYKSIIQHKILFDMDQIREDQSSSQKLDALMYVECKVKQFEVIIDDVMFEELWNRLKSIKVSAYYGAESAKVFHLVKKMADFLKDKKDNQELKEKVLSTYRLGDLLNIISEIYSDHEKNKEVRQTRDILCQFMLPDLLLTKQYRDLQTISRWITFDSLNAILKAIDEKPTTNSLIMLMMGLNKFKDSLFNKGIVEEITTYLKDNVGSFNQEQMTTLITNLNIGIDVHQINWNQQYKETKQEQNIFLFEEMIYEALQHEDKLLENNSSTQSFLLNHSPEFKNRILQENIKLMSYMVVESIDQPDFFWKYIEQHAEDIKNDEKLLKELLANESIIDELTQKLNIKDERSEEIYQELLVEAKQNKNKEEFNFSRRNKSNYALNLYNQLLKPFLYQKIGKLLSEKNYEEIELIFMSYGSEKHIYLSKFFEEVQQWTFKQIHENLSNPSFKNILCHYFNDKNYNFFKLSHFSEQENTILAKELSKNLFSKEDIFSIFPLESSGFINQYVVDNMPEKMFYNSLKSLAYNQNREGAIVKQPYTNEQIIKSYLALDNSFIFEHFNDIVALIKSNFAEDNKDKQSQFKELLKLGESYPILYVALSNTDIIGELSYEENSETPYSERMANYVSENMNIELIFKGIEEIFTQYEAYQQEQKEKMFSNHNDVVIFDAVSDVIYNTYRTDMINGQDCYYSNLSDNQTKQLLHILWEKSPLLLLSYEHIGACSDISQELKDNFADYMNVKEYSIEELIAPPKLNGFKRYNPDFNEDKDYERNKTTHGYIKGLVNYLITKDKPTELNYITYLMQQHHFIKSEMIYPLQESSHLQGETKLLNYVNQNSDLMEIINKTEYKFFLDEMLVEKEVEDVRPSRKI